MSELISVSGIGGLGPELGRVDISVPEGLTIAEIVSTVLPGATRAALERARVWLVSNAGETLVSARAHWHRIRPRAGVRVMIRLAPAGDALRDVLLIAVSVAAAAIGQFWAAPMIGSWATGLGFGTQIAGLIGQVGGALVTAGLTLAGGYLVNMLIPPAQQSGQQSERPLFSISGWRNRSNPDGVVPSLLGEHRVAPVYAAPSYTEVVGDNHYIRSLFTFGYGRVSISDLKIGETPISQFSDIDYEIREGLAGDDPVSIYPSQVIEENLGVELRRDRIRNAAGDITGTGPETPIVRYTASDAEEACVVLQFPSGLIAYETEGNNAGDPKSRTVSIRIEQRPASGGSWATVRTMDIKAKKREGFFRAHRWTLPSRGRWQIRVTRVTHEPTVASVADRSVWAVLQSFRPEYPLNFDKPLCLVAMRVRATYQLNSVLDTFNAMATRHILDWDHETESWVTRPTRNPAAMFRHILQGPEAAFPEPDSSIDLEALQEWHDYCRSKGLKYDRNRDFDGSQWDALAEVAAAGRAGPRYDGTKWSVIVDRPRDLVVAHVNDRNARDFSWMRNYVEPPHAFRVRFLDEGADYQQRERVVRWPGYVGDITVTEDLPMPGKTDPDEIWREARRRQYEVIHRPDTFSCVQDGAVRTATRGDLVKASFETLSRTLISLRVSEARERVLTLDGYVEMTAPNTYAVRFMRQIGEGDSATFESVLRSVEFFEGLTDTIILPGDGPLPEAGDLLQFGLAGQESIDLILAGTQSGDQMTSVLAMLAAAPIIDDLTDAEVPPAWDGRAGSDAGAVIAVPAVPEIVGIETLYVDDIASGLSVLIEPGGSVVAVATYTLQHRLSGSGVWTIVAGIPGGDGGVDLLGYAAGDIVELQVLATSPDGYSSAYSASVFGEVASPEPAPDPIPSATVVGGMGAAFINYSTPAGPNFASVKIYRNVVDDFGSSALVATLSGAPLSSYSHVDGDGTKVSLIANGGFASDADWSEGDGWAIAGGVATKTPGVASQIEQALALTEARSYRFAFDLLDVSAGDVTPALVGGTDVDGAPIGTDGQVLGSLVAGSANTGFAIKADADFEGTIDNVIVYEQGLTSLAQGNTFYWITAANAEGRESAPLALGDVTII
ncbi:host specificity protein J [Pelagibacterium halotolerans]|uniref:Tip attachment protein J HDII-ins2 domain-containing protein n=1 Tax=Pelagibacterium halotolerans (strain DSM 22347 / JCM 15775 / CGMCC 1.7692 / B2) TaxID=1082931 RepID=G4RDB6_PELHB|nr:tail fiber protein [Pelagibacterium halotolerans]AEQ50742.1 hypothetical protein KKY_703 [Pelagibacterium halotolerans B2]QJR19336.1 phage tail protein [Pelagibacterium halotolerans]SDZ94582.1 hypothetical protein SAMN05428936_101629 [Pelagibacterium halotolerans]